VLSHYGFGIVKIDPSHGLAVDRLLERLVVENTMKAVVFLLALTPLASYALWVSDGCEPNLPFISDMDLLPRSGFTFTLGYAISGVLLTLAGFQLGSLRGIWISEKGLEERWLMINKVSMFAAMAAGISLFWISFTPWNEQFELHILQANVIFIGSVIWSIGMTIVTWAMSKEDSSFAGFIPFRVISTGLGVIGLVGMLERFARYTGISTDLYALEERLGSLDQDCTSVTSELLSQAAAFEWMLAGSMILVLASVLPEIKILAKD
tara:strand:- start:2194 stop:2988 length:795 start_codon:yes stop_codon:yes gene_type:complete